MGQKSIEDKPSNLLPSTNTSNPPSQNYFLRTEEKFSLKIYTSVKVEVQNNPKTRSSWFNCALRDDEAVYWVSIGRYEAVAVGN